MAVGRSRIRLKISGSVKVGASILVMTNAVADQFLYNLKKQPKDQPVIIKYEHLTT